MVPEVKALGKHFTLNDYRDKILPLVYQKARNGLNKNLGEMFSGTQKQFVDAVMSEVYRQLSEKNQLDQTGSRFDEQKTASSTHQTESESNHESGEQQQAQQSKRIQRVAKPTEESRIGRKLGNSWVDGTDVHIPKAALKSTSVYNTRYDPRQQLDLESDNSDDLNIHSTLKPNSNKWLHGYHAHVRSKLTKSAKRRIRYKKLNSADDDFYRPVIDEVIGLTFYKEHPNESLSDLIRIMLDHTTVTIDSSRQDFDDPQPTNQPRMDKCLHHSRLDPPVALGHKLREITLE